MGLRRGRDFASDDRHRWNELVVAGSPHELKICWVIHIPTSLVTSSSVLYGLLR